VLTVRELGQQIIRNRREDRMGIYNRLIRRQITGRFCPIDAGTLDGGIEDIQEMLRRDLLRLAADDDSARKHAQCGFLLDPRGA